VVVADGDTTVLPLGYWLPENGSILTKLELLTVQVNVANCPAVIVEGLTVKLEIVGDGGNMQPVPRRHTSKNTKNIFFTSIPLRRKIVRISMIPNYIISDSKLKSHQIRS